MKDTEQNSYALLNSALDGSDHNHFTQPEELQNAPWIGGWVSINAVAKEQSSYREPNRLSSL
jgi:hypothetical protein